MSAKKVRTDILVTARSLSKAPKRYPLDKYRKNNNGNINIRAFEMHSYRVSYQITKNKIRILRLRHTSREPLQF